MGTGATNEENRRASSWGPARLVVLRRLGHHWRGLVVAGVLLGIGFGACLSSIAVARRTDSAYGRILVEADAADATINLGQPPEQAEESLREIDGVTDVRVYVGFLGAADGTAASGSGAWLAPVGDRFPIVLPTLHAGRLPDPDAPDELFVNTSLAERGGLEVGQRLHFRFLVPGSTDTEQADVTIVGIGTLPPEAVADETLVVDVGVFTAAFYEAHRDLAAYASAIVDLAPGVDARRDLAVEVGRLGDQLQAVTSHEQQAVDAALRPLIIVLVALGVLTFGVTAVAAGQVIARNRARWQADDVGLRTLGMTRSQIRAVAFAFSGILAALAVGAALVTMLIASPIGPVGPLHDLDPAQGLGIDAVVAAGGAVAVLVTIALLTVAISPTGRTLRPPVDRSPRVGNALRSPTTIAGFALATHAEDGRTRAWRGVAATTAAAAVVAICAAFVASALELTTTPANYGFDADLLALNPYGDQAASDLVDAFGDRDDVAGATAYTSGGLLVDGFAVPGLAATPLKGELAPTMLQGDPPRSDDEIAVGQDTLDSIGAGVGDVVPVQIFDIANAGAAAGAPAGEALDLRIVGVMTFPPVSQIGTDMPRLGVGALVTRDGFLRLDGEPTNEPEFTTVRLVEGTDPADVIARHPDGFQDAAHTTTSWFTDTKPAELRQLDAAMPYLGGTLLVGYGILLAVVVHALWSRARSHRRACAALRALGFTGGQLDRVAALQTVPFAIAALLIGIPIGLLVGRRVYTRFAESLAVVEETSTPLTMVAALVVGVLLAVAIGGRVAVAVARRHRGRPAVSEAIAWTR